jgi:hypothetical protein
MGETFTSRPDADQLVLDKARTYAYKGRYLQVIVFCKNRGDADALIKAFSGHRYKHVVGWYWVLSKRADIVALVEKLETKFPSKHRFENMIIEYYIKES